MLGGKMAGLTWASLKKNSMLFPLFFCVGAGAVGSSFYLMRLAFKSPDVSWFPRTNPEPWNDYKDKDYKLLAMQEKQKYMAQPPKY